MIFGWGMLIGTALGALSSLVGSMLVVIGPEGQRLSLRQNIDLVFREERVTFFTVSLFVVVVYTVAGGVAEAMFSAFPQH